MRKRSVAAFVPSVLLRCRLPKRAGSKVLLTFDDGPHPEATPALLGVLERYSARAIFFEVGNRIERAPEMPRRVVEAGHELGNHSYQHQEIDSFPYRYYLDDLQRCQVEIFQHAGVFPRFHRPPRGVVSLSTIFAPLRLGLRTIHWSISSEDWRFQSDAEAKSAAKADAQRIRPRDIVLLHEERFTTISYLETLLPALVRRGIQFDSPIGSLAGPCLGRCLQCTGADPRNRQPAEAIAPSND